MTLPMASHANPNGTRNLYQRLAAIGAEVVPIKPTGKTAQGQPALSIVDVEDALRALFIKHGIVSGYRWNSLPVAIARTGKSGEYTEWQADLTLWLMNPDDPKEFREDRVCDIGSSPSAAVSFALKRYWRALFHLADASDEVPATAPNVANTTIAGRREAAKVHKPIPDIIASPKGETREWGKWWSTVSLAIGLQSGKKAEQTDARAFVESVVQRKVESATTLTDREYQAVYQAAVEIIGKAEAKA